MSPEARLFLPFILLPELDTSKHKDTKEAADKNSYTPSTLLHPGTLALADSRRTSAS
jgi:hypothetical protein